MDGVYAALARVPFFRKVRQEAMEIERLDDALTNVCYKVTVGGAAYVLRLARKAPRTTSTALPRAQRADRGGGWGRR